MDVSHKYIVSQNDFEFEICARRRGGSRIATPIVDMQSQLINPIGCEARLSGKPAQMACIGPARRAFRDEDTHMTSI